MRGTSFVVRFESQRPATAHEAAQALGARLASRGDRAHVEAGARELPGTTLLVGVHDAHAPDGEPRWLAPLLVRDEPEGAADDAIAFLERWGFVMRRDERRLALS